MSSQSLFDRMKTYVGFSEEDSDRLRPFTQLPDETLLPIIDHFYKKIVSDEEAYSVLDSPEQIDRLKKTLLIWVRQLFAGPHNDEYFELRASIGRRHVAVGLPQHLTFTSMAVIREDLSRVIQDQLRNQPSLLRDSLRSLHALLDLELAIILETYREDFVKRESENERMATIGELGVSLYHEIKEPLHTIQSSLSIIKETEKIADQSRAHHHLDKINRGALKAGKICNELLDFSKISKCRIQEVELKDFFDSVIQSSDQPPQVTLSIDLPDHPRFIPLDRQTFGRAIHCLIDNAVNSLGDEKGTVSVRLIPKGAEVEITVSDNGCGIAEENIRKIFEPMYSQTPNGIGLGLTMTQQVVRQHGGRIEAKSQVGHGSQFTIYLPAQIHNE
ncbi:MAG: protoglobin domain-containing protein [Planctomycetota bacterium]|nr:protoglobin domain-containing protein [Planctomycetota bacterium]